MDRLFLSGDTVSQTNVLSFARINVVYLPELGGQLLPWPPVSYGYDWHIRMDLRITQSADCARGSANRRSPEVEKNYVDDCVDNSTWLNLLLKTNMEYFYFTQMARRAGQNEVTGRIRPAGRRLPDGGLDFPGSSSCMRALSNTRSLSTHVPALS